MFFRKLLFLVKLIFIFNLWSCSLFTVRPKMEMSIAQAAYQAAKEVKAFEKQPDLYRKAEFFYLQAKSAYQRKDFDNAKKFALLSTKFSEEAEYLSIKKDTLQGNQ